MKTDVLDVRYRGLRRRARYVYYLIGSKNDSIQSVVNAIPSEYYPKNQQAEAPDDVKAELDIITSVQSSSELPSKFMVSSFVTNDIF